MGANSALLLCGHLLHEDPDRRPTPAEILRYPLIRNQLRKALQDNEDGDEDDDEEEKDTTSSPSTSPSTTTSSVSRWDREEDEEEEMEKEDDVKSPDMIMMEMATPQRKRTLNEPRRSFAAVFGKEVEEPSSAESRSPRCNGKEEESEVAEFPRLLAESYRLLADSYRLLEKKRSTPFSGVDRLLAEVRSEILCSKTPPPTTTSAPEDGDDDDDDGDLENWAFTSLPSWSKGDSPWTKSTSGTPSTCGAPSGSGSCSSTPSSTISSPRCSSMSLSNTNSPPGSYTPPLYR